MTAKTLHIYRYGRTHLHAAVVDMTNLPPQDVPGFWRHVADTVYTETDAPRVFEARKALSDIERDGYHLFEADPNIEMVGWKIINAPETSSSSLGDFRTKLTGLAPGKAAQVPYEIFEELFSPGVEDDGAKERAYKFARECGCVIDHRPGTREVLFVKPVA